MCVKRGEEGGDMGENTGGIKGEMKIPRFP